MNFLQINEITVMTLVEKNVINNLEALPDMNSRSLLLYLKWFRALRA